MEAIFKTGNVYVHNGIKSNSDIAKYIAEVSKDDDVVALKNDVEKELNEACESDRYLKDFINKLKASSQKATQAPTKKK